ncbi:MAG: hypothetical protein HUU10_00105 [Bacteroidetes bacterium]|nr:hypothetical protein [Bacteroidota bacterium]
MTDTKKTKKAPKKPKQGIVAPRHKIMVIGHRGNSGLLPENSVNAVASCLDESTIDGAEIDVQITKDGELIVFHDEDLSRFGGPKARISTLPMAELKKVDYGVLYNKKFKGVGIATLDDILSLVPEDSADFLLNIELKISPLLKGEFVKNFVNRLYMQVDSWIDPRHVLFSSFNWESLDLLRHYSQDMKLGVLTDQPDERGWISKVKQLSAQYIIVPISKVDKEFETLVKDELETSILAYTEHHYTDKESELNACGKVIQHDIHGLIVNHPLDVYNLIHPQH